MILALFLSLVHTYEGYLSFSCHPQGFVLVRMKVAGKHLRDLDGEGNVKNTPFSGDCEQPKDVSRQCSRYLAGLHTLK